MVVGALGSTLHHVVMSNLCILSFSLPPSLALSQVSPVLTQWIPVVELHPVRDESYTGHALCLCPPARRLTQPFPDVVWHTIPPPEST